MAKGFKHGAGGGSPLNFKVVGGTSAPSNPKENTIWVNTGTAITSWVFSATQPTGSSGMVWFPINTSSSTKFNALKKNNLQVYALSARQYVSNAWTNKAAKIYQGGKWVDLWDGKLYYNSNQYTAITGGWANNTSLYAKSSSATYENSGAAPSFGTYITVTASSNKSANATTKNAIDLTNYSKLRYELSSDSASNNCVIQVHQMKNGELYNNYAVQGMPTPGSSGSLNISSLKGLYYITIFTINNRTAKFGNIRLE